MGRVARTLITLVVAAAFVPSAGAQETSIAFTLSPGFVRFNDFGSMVNTLVAQVSVARELTSRTGAEVSAFSALPLEQMSAQPGCIAGSVCEARSTPSALIGGVAAFFLQPGDSPLRLSAGIGRVSARGMEGPGAQSSNVFQLGLEWSQQRQGGVRMTAGLRALQFATPISGARQLVLPGVGIRF